MFRVNSSLGDIKKKIKATDQQMTRVREDVLEVIGTQLLSFAQHDYRVKSRSGTGTDGIKWKPLAASTIKAKSKRGKKNEKRKTTKGGKARPLAGSTAIGIDTGLQMASASPGFRGPDGKGGNLKQVDKVGVTVGYARSYSGYFDEARPLLPTTLPKAWRDSIEKVVKSTTERIIRNGLL